MQENMRIQLKDSYSTWMASFDSKFHLTLSFSQGAVESKTRNLLNRLMINLNKAIFKARYRRGETYVTGFAIREPTPSLNTDHFHILMTDDFGWLPDNRRMLRQVNRQVEYVNRTADRDKITSAMLQNYYNQGHDDLENYLVKQFNDKSIPWEQASDSIGILTKDMVQFGRANFQYKAV